MSQSQAKRHRRKLVRENSRNPELDRMGWNGVNPVTKKTPTIQEKQRKIHNKHKQKWNLTYSNGDDSIFLLPIASHRPDKQARSVSLPHRQFPMLPANERMNSSQIQACLA